MTLGTTSSTVVKQKHILNQLKVQLSAVFLHGFHPVERGCHSTSSSRSCLGFLTMQGLLKTLHANHVLGEFKCLSLRLYGELPVGGGKRLPLGLAGIRHNITEAKVLNLLILSHMTFTTYPLLLSSTSCSEMKHSSQTARYSITSLASFL